MYKRAAINNTYSGSKRYLDMLEEDERKRHHALMWPSFATKSKDILKLEYLRSGKWTHILFCYTHS